VRRAAPALALCLLAALVLAEAVALPAAPPRVALPVPAMPAAVVAPAPPDVAAWKAVILARPLFRADRRPLAAVAAAAASLPRLSAIVVTAAGALAIFSPADGGAPITAGAGSAVDGYTLVRIAPDSVTVRAPDGALRRLDPQFATPGATAAAAPPPMPPLRQDHF
jgi:general secretion pathway protein N